MLRFFTFIGVWRRTNSSILRSLVAMLVLVALASGTMPVMAGTTGNLSGTVLASGTNAPLAGATVTATSPSQTAKSTTDAGGRFTFLGLAPDTYTVSVDVKGYAPASTSGVTIQADATRQIGLVAQKTTLITIGNVTARANSNLVRAGTTVDQYTVSAQQAQAFQGVGGGGNLNNAYSAIATVPGVFTPQGVQGGNGIGNNVYIRGGDYDQVGFEIDGVPVNRSFDNYPSGPAANLGQQELQVYTGSAPATAEGQGLAGFINQVIRVGTYPSFVQADVGIGGPAYYHKAAFEAGGATRDRNFSYYVGIDGYNQDFRYGDQFNGQSLTQNYGTAIAPCPASGITPAQVPSCFSPSGQNYNQNVFSPGGASAYALASYNLFDLSELNVRDNVINLHFGLPHKSGGLKDDIQALFVQNSVTSQYYSSTNDQGGVDFVNNAGLGTPTYVDGFQYAGATGTFLPANYQALTSPYYYPLQNSNKRDLNAPIAVDQRDAINNDQDIFKLQYTHSFSSSAQAKIYGYTYYSDWLMKGPQSAYADFFGPDSPDYELTSHTRGVSGNFSDQIGDKNLLQFQASFTTSRALRDNNTQNFNGAGSRSLFAELVDSSNPLNGICYDANNAPASCGTGGAGQFASFSDAANGAIKPATGTCGGGPCQYLVVGNGQYATYNTVRPNFTAVSLTDQFRPSSKLTIDAGIRLDHFEFALQDTSQGPARTFFYNAFNLDHCTDATGALVSKEPLDACPEGTTALNVTNPSGGHNQVYNEYQPRLGGTYAFDPNTVLRASYGRYAQAPNSAYEQYDTLQPNAPQTLYGTYGFQQFGFTTPDHDVRPQVSNNYDFSLEKQFPGALSLKISPFLRTTQDQIQQFYLNQQTGFVSGLNVGKQTSQGVELEIDKGNFASNGFSAKLAATYTNSYIRYNRLSNGSSIIDPLNGAIKQYNAYTSYCANKPNDASCGATSSGVAAAPCYSTAGAALAVGQCTTGTVANPYWNSPVQGLLDPSGNYPTFDTFPAGIGSSVQGFGAPYIATLVVQYRRNKFAVTPNVQFSAGERYGAPETTYGIAPDTCTGTLGSGTAGDPRYPYGAPGGGAYDAGTCGSLGGGIPDKFTNRFDGIGDFAAPSQLQLGTQFSYEASRGVTLIATLSNLVNTCFGGTKTGFTVKGACNYGVIGGGSSGDVGNTYNPGAVIQPYVNTPYLPEFSGYPASYYLTARVRL